MNISWTGRPCCTAHINAGVPGGCHVLPKDAIRLALDERAHGFNKALEQHYAAKKAVADGMLPPDYQIPPMPIGGYDK